MKEGMLKKQTGISILIMLILVLTTTSAFAETATIPVNMVIEPLTLDFEITESIEMTASGGSNNLQIENLTVTNAADNYGMVIAGIAVEQQGEWKLISDANDFTAVVDTKQFSLTTSGHDFSSGSYRDDEVIGPGESKVIEFEGKVGSFREEVYEQAANLIVTLEFEPQLFSFRINLAKAGGGWTLFTARKGMTWGEWIESEYNTEGFIPCKYGGCHILHPYNYPVIDTKGDISVTVDSEILEYNYQMTENYEKGSV